MRPPPDPPAKRPKRISKWHKGFPLHTVPLPPPVDLPGEPLPNESYSRNKVKNRPHVNYTGRVLYPPGQAVPAFEPGSVLNRLLRLPLAKVSGAAEPRSPRTPVP